jgi:hypothetical protein
LKFGVFFTSFSIVNYACHSTKTIVSIVSENEIYGLG